MIDCIYARDTGNPWGLCQCTAVECRSGSRIAHVYNHVITSPVDYHTRYPTNYNKNNDTPPAYVLVRSKFCCREKCSYYRAEP